MRGRKGDGHGPEFSKELMPVIDGGPAPGGRKLRKKVVQVLEPIGRQGDNGSLGVDEPSQYFFTS